MKINLTVKKYRQEGDMAHEYGPFRTLVESEGENKNQLTEFNTDEIDVDLNNPLSIECQPSYDGTVNLIINDDKNPPRIINSRFSRLENNRYKIINRNQKHQTNLYDKGKVDMQTRLFRVTNSLPKFDLVNVNNFGQLPGGNYQFYLKLADNDYNKTDIIAESGVVSVFAGTINKPETNYGTLEDENTDKSITMRIKNLDLAFSKFYIYYTRDYSDTNGFRKTKHYMVTKPYEITSDLETFSLNGYEETEEISAEELNIQYNIATNVKTQAQVQNRLFFGNIEETNVKVVDLQNISYFIDVTLCRQQDSIGWIDDKYKQKSVDDLSQCEYYSPKNIYYNLGYWPDEIYRLGVVYIMNDDTLSPVFNLRGCQFKSVSLDGSKTIENNNLFGDVRKNISSLFNDDESVNYIERDVMLNNDCVYLDNTLGVFKNPNTSEEYNIHQYGEDAGVHPWFYKMELSGQMRKLLKEKYHVKGYFFVRQKRIPITICQGLTVGVDSSSFVPMLYKDNKYFTEGFLNKNVLLSNGFTEKTITTNSKQCSGLLSTEAMVTPSIQSMLDGSEFLLSSYKTNGELVQSGRLFGVEFKDENQKDDFQKGLSIYVNENIPIKYVNNNGYSTKAGLASDVQQVSFFAKRDANSANNTKLLRGVWTPFIGTDKNLLNNSIYNIRQKNYSEIFLKEYFTIRANDNSPFYSVSDRYDINETGEVDVYRGDCFTTTTTIRMNRNLVDDSVPVNDIIVKPTTWKDNFKGFNSKTTSEDWLDINRADINSVQMGHWVTFKTLSTRNIGLRAIDHSNVDEEALMGSPRVFYPVRSASVHSANKVADSAILDDGYNSTVNQRRNTIAPNVPYIKDMFDNRIMFSTPQATDSFKNNYRIFQGLAYQDIDRQYGAIVKLIPWGNNLLCVFEHGISMIAVNEKALIQTTTSQNVHMYGASVLQEQNSVISQDYGSIWPESIIRTPIGVYGVDTYAKKIWRYSDSKGLEVISDMKIQSFLNEHIKLTEHDKYNIVALRNVKSHYNNYKGDVMFTFYNYTEDEEWNICWNERQSTWITRYTWTPLYSANINNIFYTLDKKRASVLAHIFENRNTNSGIIMKEDDSNIWSGDSYSAKIELSGYSLSSELKIEINGVRTSYIDGDEKYIKLDKTQANKAFSVSGKGKSVTISSNTSRVKEVFGFVPKYYLIDVTVTPYVDDSEAIKFNDTIGVIAKPTDKQEWDKLLQNGFYVHGRAGIFDEIDYTDDDKTNQITPTKWYDKQEPFEFEFVVKDPVGLQKIFNNLVIISNNVEPKSLEFEIVGDSYLFNKARIYNLQKNLDFNKKTLYESKNGFKNVEVDYDHVLNQYTLVAHQDSKNLEEYGRMRGNIHYKEDAFYLNIEPIKYNKQLNDHNINPKDIDGNNIGETRIRDKWCKIRIKYSGEDLVVITAIKTLMTLSYA